MNKNDLNLRGIRRERAAQRERRNTAGRKVDANMKVTFAPRERSRREKGYQNIVKF